PLAARPMKKTNLTSVAICLIILSTMAGVAVTLLQRQARMTVPVQTKSPQEQVRTQMSQIPNFPIGHTAGPGATDGGPHYSDRAFDIPTREPQKQYIPKQVIRGWSGPRSVPVRQNAFSSPSSSAVPSATASAAAASHSAVAAGGTGWQSQRPHWGAATFTHIGSSPQDDLQH
ncbi:MAG TPA: hypothetical protein V6C72_08205, partial [Chroococcales cyanobacterium]